MTKHFSTGSFIGGFMLGAIVVGGWTYKENLAFPLSVQPDPTEASTTSPLESGAIEVTDQPAGRSVTIESLTVPPPGVWIAVRDVNGKDLGNVLGAAHVNGPHTNITVPLLRATEPGLTYAVQLYRDDGGRTFDLAHDSVYVDFTTGEAVITYFTTN